MLSAQATCLCPTAVGLKAAVLVTFGNIKSQSH
jgi:hypothetical protein